MNKVNPKKLLNSKWTALVPRKKEKHFLVVEVDYDEDGSIAFCIIEAIINKRQAEIDWQKLKDDKVWQQGWY